MALCNKEAALKRLDGDTSIYRRMVDFFIRDYTDFPERIASMINRSDEQAYVLTHSLKNIAASLGADHLAQLALTMESRLKVSDFDSCQDILRDIIEEFGLVSEEIRTFAREEETLLDQESQETDNRGEGYSCFRELLGRLSENFGSFSPEDVGTAMKKVRNSWDLIPEKYRDEMEEILILGRDYRYLEGEEKINQLRSEVLA